MPLIFMNVAVRCSALQCVAVCCSEWVAVCCSVLQCVAVCSGDLLIALTSFLQTDILARLNLCV